MTSPAQNDVPYFTTFYAAYDSTGETKPGDNIFFETIYTSRRAEGFKRRVVPADEVPPEILTIFTDQNPRSPDCSITKIQFAYQPYAPDGTELGAALVYDLLINPETQKVQLIEDPGNTKIELDLNAFKSKIRVSQLSQLIGETYKVEAIKFNFTGIAKEGFHLTGSLDEDRAKVLLTKTAFHFAEITAQIKTQLSNPDFGI